VKKSVLDAYLALMRKLGIRPTAVTTGSLALANLFLQSGVDTANKIFVLADLRPGGIELLALRDGSLIYTHESARADSPGWKETLLRELDSMAATVRLGPEDSIDKI